MLEFIIPFRRFLQYQNKPSISIFRRVVVRPITGAFDVNSCFFHPSILIMLTMIMTFILLFAFLACCLRSYNSMHLVFIKWHSHHWHWGHLLLHHRLLKLLCWSSCLQNLTRVLLFFFFLLFKLAIIFKDANLFVFGIGKIKTCK